MNGTPLATWLGLLLALGGTTALAFLKHDREGPIQKTRHLLTTWGGSLALLALVLYWEQRPLSSIGIVWGNYAAWSIGGLCGVLVLAMSALPMYFAKGTMPEDSLRGVRKILATPLAFRLAAIVTAGTTEELTFRGYPIERLHEIGCPLWLAALIPLLVFTLAHLSMWGKGHLASVAVGGGLLTGLYLWQRDLIACMIAHTLIDCMILLMPMLLKRYEAVVQARAASA